MTLTARIVSVSTIIDEDCADLVLDHLEIDGEPVSADVSLTVNLAAFGHPINAGMSFSISSPIIEDQLAAILARARTRAAAGGA